MTSLRAASRYVRVGVSVSGVPKLISRTSNVSVPCPVCKAGVGEACLNADAQPARSVHKSRQRMATRAANARINHDPAGFAASLTPFRRRAVRTALGLSQAEAGKFFGLAPGPFGRMENGARTLHDAKYALYGTWLQLWIEGDA